MKLSSETISVLKNFATINQNLIIKSGSELNTMSAMNNILGKAKVKESFPQEFAIYDLNEFLAAISLFVNPDLDFKDDFVVITETGSSSTALKYWYSDPSVVTTPTKDIIMPECEVNFDLSNEKLSTITKAAAVIGAPDMSLESMSSTVALLKVTDKKNATANDYALSLDVDNEDELQDATYKFWFKVENLKLIPGSYRVQVSSKNISHFKNSSDNVEYFIALESESKYNA